MIGDGGGQMKIPKPVLSAFTVIRKYKPSLHSFAVAQMLIQFSKCTRMPSLIGIRALGQPLSCTSSFSKPICNTALSHEAFTYLMMLDIMSFCTKQIWWTACAPGWLFFCNAEFYEPSEGNHLGNFCECHSRQRIVNAVPACTCAAKNMILALPLHHTYSRHLQNFERLHFTKRL